MEIAFLQPLNLSKPKVDRRPKAGGSFFAEQYALIYMWNLGSKAPGLTGDGILGPDHRVGEAEEIPCDQARGDIEGVG